MAGNNGVFPELVLDIGTSSSRTPTTATQSPLAQTVENALREVLAWRPRAGDAKGFTAALNQVFSINEVDGQTTFTWTPRSYAVQADMGAVTGAQASIFSRAKAALDQSVPLLEGLFPLRPDDDAEDVDAIRAVVIGKFTELVNELSVVGGPRIERIEDYFDSLLDDNSGDDPEQVGGLFGQMREEFGFKRELVNTVDEEQNLTNYLIVVDHVIALQRSWKNLKHYFDHKHSDVYLGTQLVQLSRALGVVSESVEELYFVMDSVFLGVAERQSVRLESGLTIDELFSWISRFATEEALQLIRDGGKDGVISFRPTVKRLSKLVGEALQQSKSEESNTQRGFRHPRTQAALEEVRRHLNDVVTLTEQLKRGPSLKVHLVELSRATENANLWVDIFGENFQRGATVYLTVKGEPKDRINSDKVIFISETSLKAHFNSDAQITSGREKAKARATGHAASEASEWVLVVRNNDGETGQHDFPIYGDRGENAQSDESPGAQSSSTSSTSESKRQKPSSSDAKSI